MVGQVVSGGGPAAEAGAERKEAIGSCGGGFLSFLPLAPLRGTDLSCFCRRALLLLKIAAQAGLRGPCGVGLVGDCDGRGVRQSVVV